MIVFFCDSINSNTGWSSYLHNIYKCLNNKKKIIIICHKINNTIKVKQYPLLRHPLDYSNNPFLIFIDVFKVIFLLKRSNYNFLNLHIICEPYVLFLPFIYKFFKKNFLTAHGSYSLILNYSLRTKFFFKIALRFINQVIYVSEYTKEKLYIIYNSNHIKKVVIDNAIEPAKQIKYKVRKKNNFISVGSIKPRKGHHHLIESVNNLVNKNCKNFHLTIVGSTDDLNYLKILKEKIFKYRLEKYISFTGFLEVSRLRHKMANAKLFILLSDDFNYQFEGFGLVYLEALNNGLYVVISKKSGFSNFKIPYNCGIVLKPNNYSEISNYLKKIVNNKIKINSNNYQLLSEKWYLFKNRIMSLYQVL
jgi:teichuronic acid biosynthesis glycosyltransferase TuaC